MVLGLVDYKLVHEFTLAQTLAGHFRLDDHSLRF